MARTPAQRGTFGRWLTEAREARYKRQSDALDAMRRLAGLVISPSEYAQWESGSRVPRPDNPKVARLYEFFGSSPEALEATQGGDDLAAAIRMLVGELQAMREEREGIEARLRALEAVSPHAPREGAALPERSVPRATAE